ncbi:hypothetical protein LQ327_01340 [Actinomycetospora endophytica]|uniref:Alpha/beta hydrolase domain-containing protein n=1 Tax=Actinomycetospora endophytica TaxID=2291215 RepID=A0ABS8P1R8_9PSEU|nr:alpha/beta hydrolase domain-containing protein [Actinomycetospora endophytica]MCD2192034.1 hypothetical protein [Actinomycetospora endophytica]
MAGLCFALCLVAGTVGCGVTSPTGDGVGVEVPGLPAVSGPIPVSAQSYPFLASDHDVSPIDVAASGYVEQEYLVAGPARVFSWPASDTLRVAATGSYTTRILIRRPADPARFSGRVRVEPLNTTSGHDLDGAWEIGHAGFMHAGDAYVGITVGPQTISSLKRFDPARYASLQMADPQPDTSGCPTPHQIDPGGEPGLAWDVISQVGGLIRSTAPSNPLRDLRPRESTLTGWSQSGSYDLTYLGAVARHETLPGGGPVFDGYVPGAGGYAGTPISRCAPLPAPGDPRARFDPPPGVPVEVVSTPTDFASAASFPRATDRPDDSDTPDRRIRLYEIGGGSHLPADQGAFFPDDAELVRAGLRPENRVAYPLSRFPLHVVLDAAFANLDAWVDHGVPPPHATRLTVADPADWPPEATTDALGNPVGGVRTTASDVPTATFAPRGLKAPGSNQSAYAGYDITFSLQYLQVLYPGHGDYVTKVTADARELQARRWLTEDDAEDLIRAADRAPVP